MLSKNDFEMNVFMIIAFMMVGLLGIDYNCPAQDNGWQTRENMPTTRLNLAATVVDGKIYVIGGTTGNGMPGLATVEEYNPVTDTWLTKKDMPTARTGLSTSAVNGKIYAIGGALAWGGTGLYTVEEYDPVTDTWTTKENMPTARANLATCEVNGKIYAIGGANGPTVTSAVEEYDPLTNTWTPKDGLPTARNFPCTSVINGLVYVIAGAVSPQVMSSAVEVYDPVSDSWSTQNNMLATRGAFSSVVVNGNIYAIGGVLTSFSAPLSTVEEYDPVTDTWTLKTNIPTARSFLSAGAVNEKIYVIGGSVTAAPTVSPTNAVEEFNTEFVASIESNINRNLSSFILYQNYPNPFNPTTTISYDLPHNAQVKLTVYDLLGHEVMVIVYAEQPAGIHNVSFNGTTLAGGVYFYQLQAELENGKRFVDMKKLILLK